MLKLEEVLQLKDGEEVRMVAKRHIMTAMPGLLLALLLIVMPFFFLFPLFSTGPTGVIVFAVFVLVGCILAWRAFAMWDGDAFIVSTVRVIRVAQTGIFSRTVQEVGNDVIREVSWMKKGLLGQLFNFGTITIGGVNQQVKAENVPHPQDVHALINEMREGASKSKNVGGTDHLTRIERLQKAVETMGEEDLRKLERSLKEEGRKQAIDDLFGGTKEIASEAVAASPSKNDPHMPKQDEDGIEVKKLFGEGSAGSLKPLDEIPPSGSDS